MSKVVECVCEFKLKYWLNTTRERNETLTAFRTKLVSEENDALFGKMKA